LHVCHNLEDSDKHSARLEKVDPKAQIECVKADWDITLKKIRAAFGGNEVSIFAE
jgi:hypothetical protein